MSKFNLFVTGNNVEAQLLPFKDVDDIDEFKNEYMKFIETKFKSAMTHPAIPHDVMSFDCYMT